MAHNIPDPSLTDLAAEVSSAARTIQAYLMSNGLPSLSFRQDAADRFPADASQEVNGARIKLLEASQTLHDLALGPAEYLKVESANSLLRLMTLNWISHFRIADHVPLTGTISYTDLAKQTGVPVAYLRRILRMAMICRLFREPAPDQVTHSVASRLLREPPGEGLAWIFTKQMMPVLSTIPKTHETYGDSTNVFHSAWNHHHGVVDEQSYSWWQKHDPEKLGLFTQAMADAWQSPDRNIRYLIEGFDWAALPLGSTVVDVGGNLGHISVALARELPQLKFIVEDLPTNTELGENAVPEDVRDRIDFMSHDFFTPQPVRDADVYLIHWVLLDHTEERAAEILRQIIAVMKPSARIVIRDAVLPNPGEYPAPDELNLRIVDMMTMTMSNSGVREMEDWRRIFTLASPKLKLETVVMAAGSTTTIMALKMEH